MLALVKDFKQKTTYRARKAGQKFGWQKDFYDHIIRIREDFGAQVRYIANNPVREGLVKNWDEYPFTGPSGADLRALIDSAMTL